MNARQSRYEQRLRLWDARVGIAEAGSVGAVMDGLLRVGARFSLSTITWNDGGEYIEPVETLTGDPFCWVAAPVDAPWDHEDDGYDAAPGRPAWSAEFGDARVGATVDGVLACLKPTALRVIDGWLRWLDDQDERADEDAEEGDDEAD